jgi:hypothetical protein
MSVVGKVFEPGKTLVFRRNVDERDNACVSYFTHQRDEIRGLFLKNTFERAKGFV